MTFFFSSLLNSINVSSESNCVLSQWFVQHLLTNLSKMEHPTKCGIARILGVNTKHWKFVVIVSLKPDAKIWPEQHRKISLMYPIFISPWDQCFARKGPHLSFQGHAFHGVRSSSQEIPTWSQRGLIQTLQIFHPIPNPLRNSTKLSIVFLKLQRFSYFLLGFLIPLCFSCKMRESLSPWGVMLKVPCHGGNVCGMGTD